MLKYGLKILLFIINLNYIFSMNNCDNNKNPSNENECFSKQQNDTQYPNYCCFYKNIKTNSGFCKTIPYSSYNDKDPYENIDGTLYSIKCNTNKRSVTLLEQCGNINKANEANLEKCKKHSTVLNSCCYVKGNDNIKKGCYWLGTKYEGDIKWAGVDMDCYMKYIKYSIIYLIFIFLFF